MCMAMLFIIEMLGKCTNILIEAFNIWKFHLIFILKLFKIVVETI